MAGKKNKKGKYKKKPKTNSAAGFDQVQSVLREQSTMTPTDPKDEARAVLENKKLEVEITKLQLEAEKLPIEMKSLRRSPWIHPTGFGVLVAAAVGWGGCSLSQFRLATEQQKLATEQMKVVFEQEKVLLEQKKVVLEQQRLETAKSEHATKELEWAQHLNDLRKEKSQIENALQESGKKLELQATQVAELNVLRDQLEQSVKFLNAEKAQLDTHNQRLDRIVGVWGTVLGQLKRELGRIDGLSETDRALKLKEFVEVAQACIRLVQSDPNQWPTSCFDDCGKRHREPGKIEGYSACVSECIRNAP